MTEELKKIKKMRQKLGLTQSQLAKLANVSQSIITKIERDKIEPSYSVARQILIALDEKLAGVQKEITAKEVCSKRIISVKSNDTVGVALDIMVKNAISQMPVFKDNLMVGSISEEIFIKEYNKIKSKDMKIEEIMDEAFPTIRENTHISLIKEILKFYPAVIVIKNGKPIGIISKVDILRATHV